MIEPRDERWSAWIDGELSPQEAASLEAEFAADPRRRAEAEAFRHQVLRLRAGLEAAYASAGSMDEAPSRDAETLVAAVLEASEQRAETSGGGRILTMAGLLGAGLAAAVLVGLGLWAWDTPRVQERTEAFPDEVAMSGADRDKSGRPRTASGDWSDEDSEDPSLGEDAFAGEGARAFRTADTEVSERERAEGNTPSLDPGEVEAAEERQGGRGRAAAPTEVESDSAPSGGAGGPSTPKATGPSTPGPAGPSSPPPVQPTPQGSEATRQARTRSGPGAPPPADRSLGTPGSTDETQPAGSLRAEGETVAPEALDAEVRRLRKLAEARAGSPDREAVEKLEEAKGELEPGAIRSREQNRVVPEPDRQTATPSVETPGRAAPDTGVSGTGGGLPESIKETEPGAPGTASRGGRDSQPGARPAGDPAGEAAPIERRARRSNSAITGSTAEDRGRLRQPLLTETLREERFDRVATLDSLTAPVLRVTVAPEALEAESWTRRVRGLVGADTTASSVAGTVVRTEQDGEGLTITVQGRALDLLPRLPTVLRVLGPVRSSERAPAARLIAGLTLFVPATDRLEARGDFFGLAEPSSVVAGRGPVVGRLPGLDGVLAFAIRVESDG